MDMAEGTQCQPADRALADLGEDGVAQLVEALRHHASSPIGDDQGNWHHDERPRARPGGRRQSVDRVLIEKRHVDVDELADDQKGDRQHDPCPQLERVARPQIGGERFESLQLVLETPLGARRADAYRTAVRAHRAGPPSCPRGPVSASCAAPRPRGSLSASSRVTATSTAARKYGLSRPNVANEYPAARGPRTRERLLADCDTPMTLPCSSDPARREIRLLIAGCINPMPSANPVMAPTRTGRWCTNGMSMSPAAISAKPESSNHSSPK